MKKILIAIATLFLSSCTASLDKDKIFSELKADKNNQAVYEVLLVVDGGKAYKHQKCRIIQTNLYTTQNCDDYLTTADKDIAKDLEASGFFKVILPLQQSNSAYKIEVSLYDKVTELKNIFNSPKAIFTIYKNNEIIKTYEYSYSVYAEGNRIASARLDYMYLSDVTTAFIRDSIKDKVFH